MEDSSADHREVPLLIRAQLSIGQSMKLLYDVMMVEWYFLIVPPNRFVLMIKKGYRDPPYHNWSHAFSVAHFCYTLFMNCDRLSVLSDLEVLALFVSCLCHDIDHRGTNNAFQVSSVSWGAWRW